jgi:hypothetical protein
MRGAAGWAQDFLEGYCVVTSRDQGIDRQLLHLCPARRATRQTHAAHSAHATAGRAHVARGKRATRVTRAVTVGSRETRDSITRISRHFLSLGCIVTEPPGPPGVVWGETQARGGQGDKEAGQREARGGGREEGCRTCSRLGGRARRRARRRANSPCGSGGRAWSGSGGAAGASWERVGVRMGGSRAMRVGAQRRGAALGFAGRGGVKRGKVCGRKCGHRYGTGCATGGALTASYSGCARAPSRPTLDSLGQRARGHYLGRGRKALGTAAAGGGRRWRRSAGGALGQGFDPPSPWTLGMEGLPPCGGSRAGARPGGQGGRSRGRAGRVSRGRGASRAAAGGGQGCEQGAVWPGARRVARGEGRAPPRGAV